MNLDHRHVRANGTTSEKSPTAVETLVPLLVTEPRWMIQTAIGYPKTMKLTSSLIKAPPWSIR